MTGNAERDTMDARLRSALADLRPPDGAPATLRGRIEALPQGLGEQGLASRMLRLVASPLASTVIVGAISLGVLALFGRPTTSPATTGGIDPTPAVVDPAVAGTGLLRDPIPTLPIAAGLVVLLGLTLAWRWREQWRAIVGLATFRDFARGLLVVGIVAVPSWLVVHPPLANQGGSEGTALGYGWPAYPPPGLDGPDVYYVTAAPGDPTIVFFDVTNVSALPVTLEGLVDGGIVATDPTGEGQTDPTWTSLAFASVPNTFPNTVEQLRPFSPTVLPPNGTVTVYLVGKASACAFGPGFDLATSAVYGYAPMSRDVKFAYSILGLSWTSTVTMPMQLVEPVAGACPPSTP